MSNCIPVRMTDLRSGLDQVIDWAVSSASVNVEEYVHKVRESNPGKTADELARTIVKLESVKCGLLGAVTGVGGLGTLPATLPVNLIGTWKIQALMAFAVAYVYGHAKDNSDLKTDLYLIMAGDSAKTALSRLGIEVSKTLTKKAAQKYITDEMMKAVWKVLGRSIITKAGQKSLTSVMKIVPVVGAPVGFVFDWTYARAVGKTAIVYYREV